jgi:hypothetical protein
VIPMQQSFNGIKFIVGSEKDISKITKLPAFTPFNQEIIDYLNVVSKKIIENKVAKNFPDVMTFAFWCRRASTEIMKKSYDDLQLRLGRGTIFHITPSNVAVNFAYSFVVGLLSGNGNIVRITSKNFEQVEIICSAIEDALNSGFEDLKPYIIMVKYNHNKEITDMFSILADTRIIWGGDNTISEIRKSPIKPRCNEVTFADRYSICIINSDEYLKYIDRIKIANYFFNDTYLTDQNACTSPKIIIWIGDSVQKAQKEFWYNLNKIVNEKYDLKPIQSVNKLATFCKVATKYKVKLTESNNNFIFRVQICELNEEILNYLGNSGYFYEYYSKSLNDIPNIFENSCQTITYLGLSKDEINKFLRCTRPKGIDRIVPIGRSMEFSLEWDGYDLIRILSRKIILEI